MIIAHKNGTLISAQVVKETNKYITLQPYDQKTPIKVDKDDDCVKVFDSAYDAIDWIEEKEGEEL
jgi:hypothetical protein